MQGSIVAGPPDQHSPKYDFTLEQLTPFTESMASLQELMYGERLTAVTKSLQRQLRPTVLRKPRRLLGGVSVQNEEIGQNTFGATLTADYGRIFNPSTKEERAYIARNGYISSRRRERYIEPIDRVIRAARPASELDATLIADTSRPTEIVTKLKEPKPLEHKVLLLIGSVGSGKSTFVDYLQEVAIPKDLLKSTLWCRINMNTAPVSRDEIYDWLRREIIQECRAEYPQIDFDELETIQAVFSTEVKKFRKGVGKLYETNPDIYSTQLAAHIQTLQADLHTMTHSHIRYCCAERGKLLIIVLDNCDKRLRDEQLLMFEAAQWLQAQFRALVILPLREETYENHRDQPPLDTALKDLVFRIEPPLFQHVLVRRVQLALNAMMQSGGKTLSYDLPNGFRVEYPKSDQAFYLTSILKSIFEHDKFVRRMIVGLSGRNIRRALEIFLEFCNSGHIGEDLIFKIRSSEGAYVLPFHLVARVLLRLKWRFYDSDHAYIKNIFSANHLDELPNYFPRLMILRWLYKKFNQPGVSGLKGYYPKQHLKMELGPLGIAEHVVDREVDYLLRAQCIIAEDLRIEAISDEDLLRLAPAGFVHLDLLSYVEYLAAVSEDTWFSDAQLAERIAHRISESDVHFHLQNTINNARDLVEYLDQIRQNALPNPHVCLQNDDYNDLTDLSPAFIGIERLEATQSTNSWFDADRKYPVETEHIGTIVNLKHYGIFVELEPGLTGLIHKSKLPNDFLSNDSFCIDEHVTVRIGRVDIVHQKMDLHFVRAELE